MHCLLELARVVSVQIAQPLVSHSALIAGRAQVSANTPRLCQSDLQVSAFSRTLDGINLQGSKEEDFFIDMVHHKGNGSCWDFWLLFMKAILKRC